MARNKHNPMLIINFRIMAATITETSTNGDYLTEILSSLECLLRGTIPYSINRVNSMMSEDEAAGDELAEEKKVEESVEVADEATETTVTETNAAASAETAVAQPEAETEETDTKAPPQQPEQTPKQKKRDPSRALQQIVTWFAACGRCSYFLAGYRLISDEAALETAVANRGKKWLTVPWSQELADLIHKTYGSRIDTSYYHIDGQCPECCRRFTYQEANKKDQTTTFRIELRP